MTIPMGTPSPAAIANDHSTRPSVCVRSYTIVPCVSAIQVAVKVAPGDGIKRALSKPNALAAYQMKSRRTGPSATCRNRLKAGRLNQRNAALAGEIAVLSREIGDACSPEPVICVGDSRVIAFELSFYA